MCVHVCKPTGQHFRAMLRKSGDRRYLWTFVGPKRKHEKAAMQDAVREWSKGHDHPYVAIDTTRGLEVGGGSRSLTARRPEQVRGWVAVGVTPLMQTRRDPSVWPDASTDPPPGFSLAWLRKYCPVGHLGGGSVLVYRFDSAPDPSPGPERPVSPCFGAKESTAS